MLSKSAILIFLFFINNAFSLNTQNLKPLVVMSINFCVEGFDEENYLERIQQFVEIIKREVGDSPFIIGMQEIKPFETNDLDVSVAIYEELKKFNGCCTHFLCKDVFPTEIDELKGTAIISNLKPHERIGDYLLPTGQIVSVASVHLTDTPYQLSQLIGENYEGSAPILSEKEGKTVAQQVKEGASLRAYGLECFLSAYFSSNKPAILIGDFNEPSHEDWKPGEIDVYIYGHLPHIPDVIEWPCTKAAVEKYGFRDALRSVYPSPRLFRGYTYPSSASIPMFGPAARIDHIFVRGGIVSTFEILDNYLSDHKFPKARVIFH